MNAFIRKGDFWSGLALAALAIYIMAQAWGWTYLAEDGPGPGFFPRWYGAVMLVFSLLLVAGAALRTDPEPRRTPPQWRELGRALACWSALAISVAILKYVGFMIAFALLTWFIIAVMFRRPQREALAYAIGGAVGFHALFSWALDLQLPLGSWF